MAKTSDVKVSHTNNKKAEYHGQQLGHAKSAGNPDTNVFDGPDARVDKYSTTGPDVGATAHSQVNSAPGASPNRVRFAEPQLVKENGTEHVSHVSNLPKTEAPNKVKK